MVQVATSSCVEAQGLGHNLCPYWSLGVKLQLGLYIYEWPLLLPVAMVSFVPRTLSRAVSVSAIVEKPGLWLMSVAAVATRAL